LCSGNSRAFSHRLDALFVTLNNDMSKEEHLLQNTILSKLDIETERTPAELKDWLIQKVTLICSTEEGRHAFRLQNDKEKIIKKLVEELIPLAIFGKHKFGNTNQVVFLPVIGNQNYDAKIIDRRSDHAIVTYIEITQAHEGEGDYWRRKEISESGFVFSSAPIIKTSKGKNYLVSIPAKATQVEERVKDELNRIIEAAKRKTGKHYPANSSLIIFFDDTELSDERLRILDYQPFDSFVKTNIMGMDLSFRQLYLVGKSEEFFGEFSFDISS
jgi:hypothetical protein